MPFDELHKFDLVDEMHWEDLVEFESLESAGLKVSGLERLFSHMPHLLHAADVSFYEDNWSYLAAVTTRFPSIRGVFVPSAQGH